MWDVVEIAYQAHNLMVEGSSPSGSTIGELAEWFKATVY